MGANQDESGLIWQRIGLAVFFVAGGLAIFVLGNNWTRAFATNSSSAYKWGLVVVLMALTLALWALGRGPRWRPFANVAVALLICATANVINWSAGNWLGRLLPGSVMHTEAADIAVDKLSQCIPVVLTIVVLSLLAGDSYGTLFLQRGNLRRGLRFGLSWFVVFAAVSVVLAVVQSDQPGGLSLRTLAAGIPWILVFVLANGLMEELWFRGLFLRKLAPLGPRWAVVVTALVFGASHLSATYVSPAERVIFALVVFGLGLVNGWQMFKTDSIWGSVLFHAGYDLMVIIPVLVSR